MREIEMSIDVAAPPERVWEALASEDAVRSWFNRTAVYEPREGGRIEFEDVEGDEPNRFGGKVVEYDEPRRLTFEWNWIPPRWPEPTLLTITLQPNGAFTTVTLRHHGWDRLPAEIRDDAYEHFAATWDGDELVPLRQYVEGIGPTY